jgi:hypothetical protein
VAPGKENSYTRLKVQGGKMPVAFGSRNAKLDVSDGAVVLAAQEHSNNTDDVAMKVESGSVGGHGQGRYLVQNGKVDDLSGDSDAADMVDDYVSLAQKEGGLRAKLDQAKARGASASEISKLEQQLEEAAERATEKRKELFQHREVIRGAVRRGVEGLQQRPTQAPRPPSSSHYY